MQRFTKLWLICVSLLLAYPLGASALQVKEIKANHGVKAWLVEDYHVPVVHVMIAFKNAGAASDPDGLEGRSACVAEMMMEGTTKLDSQSFNQALEDGAINLDTSVSSDQLTITLHTLSENKEKAFELMAQALRDAAFSPAKLDEVKQRIKSALKQRESNPEYVAETEWVKLAFPGHPYSKPVYGTQNSIDKLTVEQLKAYRETHLTRQNMIIAVVGAIKESEAESLISRALSDLPEHFKPDAPIIDRDVSDQPITKQIERDIPQSVMIFGKKGVARNDKDFYAAYVANYILGGKGLNSRLSEAIRQTHGLAYDVSSDLEPLQHTAAWQGQFGTRHGGELQALDLLRENMTRMAEQGATQDEFESAISYITGSFPLNMDRSESIANYLILMQLYDLGMDYLAKRNDYFRAVTLDQVNQVAKQLFDPSQLILVRVGQPDSKKD